MPDEILKLKSSNEHLHVRTARKAWVCAKCEVAIATGDQHIEDRRHLDGDGKTYGLSGDRLCAPCAIELWPEGVRIARYVEVPYEPPADRLAALVKTLSEGS